MKEVIITVFAVLAASSAANATGKTIGFDGETGIIQTSGFGTGIKILIEATDLNASNSPIPLPTRAVAVSGDPVQDLDYSIRHSIGYCERNQVSPAITENLKMLLAKGTPAEKSDFFKSKKYIFPTRFSLLKISEVADSLVAVAKGYQQNCWEEKNNCRMEQVCGQKEITENLCDLTCGPITLAGILSADVPLAVSGYVCDKSCYWAARYVPDCSNIEKCDIINHCDTIWVNDGADPVDPNTGTVAHQ